MHRPGERRAIESESTQDILRHSTGLVGQVKVAIGIDIPAKGEALISHSQCSQRS